MHRSPTHCSPAHRKTAALLEERARVFRSRPTASESALWNAISGGILGVSFKRQIVLGNFVVDFVSPRAHLVVEVDGGVHRNRRRADERRDRKLRRLGYRVLRLDAELVLHDLAEALRRISAALDTPP
jgi:very-short-patch-repair endonuclease